MRRSTCPDSRRHTWAASLVVALVAIALGSAPALVAADEPEPPPQNEGNAVFYSVSDLPYNTDPGLKVINARVADTQDWPASFYSLSAGGRCTSTLVGPKVLLTAAHCVGNGKTAWISRAGRNYVGVCTHAPDYVRNKTADWALCLMEPEVPGVLYESLNPDPNRVKERQEILLTGFGCVRPGGGGGNDGVYRIGETTVHRVPTGTNYDIVTQGRAAVCFGDSGGGAYLLTGKDESRRLLVAVNSRGNIADTSYLSSVSVEAARVFVTAWSQTSGATVCGIHEAAVGCRE